MKDGFPEIVYKYRQWDISYHQSSIVENQIYLSSPADFNDPFDCKITDNFSLLNTDEKRQKYTDRVLINTREMWINGGNNPVKKMIEFEEKLADVTKFLSEYDEYITSMNNLHYGVLCLSLEWDNILLWSHYANKHQGFCIGYRESVLREILFDRAKFGKVLYSKKYPKVDPLSEDKIQKMFLETHFKAKVWSYENEYRISKLFYPEIPDKNARMVFLPENAFVDVTLGLNIPQNHKIAILEICKAKMIPVFQTSKINYRFELKRERIL